MTDKCGYIYMVSSPYMEFFKIGCINEKSDDIMQSLLETFSNYYHEPRIHLFRIHENIETAENDIFTLLKNYKTNTGDFFMCSQKLAILSCLKVQVEHWPQKMKDQYKENIINGEGYLKDAGKKEGSNIEYEMCERNDNSDIKIRFIIHDESNLYDSDKINYLVCPEGYLLLDSEEGISLLKHIIMCDYDKIIGMFEGSDMGNMKLWVGGWEV